jgi:hypothetical protein
MNFSGTVGRINLILFALESVSEGASFDYNNTIIRYNLIFDLKGGHRLFRVQKRNRNRGRINFPFFSSGWKCPPP